MVHGLCIASLVPRSIGGTIALYDSQMCSKNASMYVASGLFLVGGGVMLSTMSPCSALAPHTPI